MLNSQSLIEFIRSWFGTDGPVPLHQPFFGDLERRYVLDAIDSSFVSSVGAYVDRFERDLAAYAGARRAVVTVNGTAALHMALQLAGVRPGDEVVTQPLTFIATANAVRYNGALPVFIDIEADTLGLSPDALASFLRSETVRRPGGCFDKATGARIAAVLPMHTFGLPGRIEEICAIAAEWNLPVVEDAAEAVGSFRSGRHCGTRGWMGVFSFNGNKTITCGGGGAIVTDDVALADRAKHLTTTAKRPHAWEFYHDEVGYNYRMPNLNAALACAQLERIESLIADKRALAAAYAQFFEGQEDEAAVVPEPPGARWNAWLVALRVANRAERDRLLAETNQAGVMTRPVWRLMPDLPMYRDCRQGPLPCAREMADRLINLPSSARGSGPCLPGAAS